jgi:hypothetical protein
MTALAQGLKVALLERERGVCTYWPYVIHVRRWRDSTHLLAVATQGLTCEHERA